MMVSLLSNLHWRKDISVLAIVVTYNPKLTSLRYINLNPITKLLLSFANIKLRSWFFCFLLRHAPNHGRQFISSSSNWIKGVSYVLDLSKHPLSIHLLAQEAAAVGQQCRQAAQGWPYVVNRVYDDEREYICDSAWALFSRVSNHVMAKPASRPRPGSLGAACLLTLISSHLRSWELWMHNTHIHTHTTHKYSNRVIE